jgi:hypothetical protein
MLTQTPLVFRRNLPQIQCMTDKNKLLDMFNEHFAKAEHLLDNELLPNISNEACEGNCHTPAYGSFILFYRGRALRSCKETQL